MKTHDFYYDLPSGLIAQTPASRRDASRLLVLDRESGEVCHRHFYDLPEYLLPGDVMVLNDSRVLHARLIGERESGGAAELMLLKELGENTWECLAKPGKRLREGTWLSFGDGRLRAEVIGVRPDGNRTVRFDYEGIFYEVLDTLGEMPLPPYIKEKLEDDERYQTVYAKHLGSAAAPTAGLHFTPELLERVRAAGVVVKSVTLHVGLGTFRPVQVEDISSHVMHTEHCIVPEDTAAAVTEAKRAGNRVIAVGTTSCRTLEAFSEEDGTLRASEGETGIFIYPGYRFKVVDALITNFHLPESTLMMLVSALAGRESILRAYETAVKARYRFFSFGDAMLIK